MFRRGEPVPFAFVAEADRFRSNVTPPPRRRASVSELAGRVVLTLVVVAGLVGAMLLAVPALEVQLDEPRGQQQEAAER
ncbi:hypothetical protein JJV70_03565 [Streptomyces sp. JJ66]|uniref:hypothetical protein n=1 Tax=Streptomyces sp. JJ66 TaxID=2803843 RepID=UPI001C57A5F2|nr:hypothetical protein [Streptomyces sp. JJ66]MBW1601195.1 hypothetical protein [Streptomyces sp. JJ66]